MDMRRSYVDTLDGQMHVTEAGTGQPIVLLPWTQRSALMYLDELDVFAAECFRAISPDLMGRGNSVTSNRSLTLARHADNIETALRLMDVQNPIIVGGHYSSQVATELVSRPSINASVLVIDGGVLIDDATSDAILDKMARVERALLPQEDGAHRQFLWNNAVNIYDIYAPGFEATKETSLTIYRFIADYLATYLQSEGKVELNQREEYPFEAVLSKLSIPAVFLSADTETLASSVEPMAAIYGGTFALHTFKGDHPLHFPHRKGEYARKLCETLKHLEG